VPIKYQDTVMQLQEMARLLREKEKSVEYSTLPEHCRSTLTANATLFDTAAFQLAKADSFIEMLIAVKVAEWQETKRMEIMDEWGYDDKDATYRFRLFQQLGSLFNILQIRKYDKCGNAFWKDVNKRKEYARAMQTLVKEIDAKHIKLCKGDQND
jgi:hypothetical protein